MRVVCGGSGRRLLGGRLPRASAGAYLSGMGMEGGGVVSDNRGKRSFLAAGKLGCKCAGCIWHLLVMSGVRRPMLLDILLVADKQQQNAASRLMLRAGQRQR